MAFFRQLRLLLWKNGLAIIRQPVWSLTLILWPLILFIIIAVTRHQFPPVVRDACYVGPRNLPSAGFFPFLQTLMCNVDSNCHNKSQLVDSAARKSSQRSASSPLAPLIPGEDLFKLELPKHTSDDTAALVKALNKMFGRSYQGSPYDVPPMNTTSTTPLGDQHTLNNMVESMNLLKRAICSIMLPMINTTSPNPVSYAVVACCKSNTTVFETSLNSLNQLLKNVMITKPEEMATFAGMAVVVFDQLQNQTSLWESLLALPKLLSSGSLEEGIASTGVLLTNIQRALRVIESHFPEAGASLSTVYPLLGSGINLTHYIQNWPGKGVTITLGEVVTLQNDSISEMVKRVLQEVEIPLDKAIALTLDRNMVRSYLCGNSSNPIWLKVACSTGTVDMLLGWISPDKVAKQALLAWSKHVAPQDVSFAKGLLQSLMGGLTPGGQENSNTSRPRRSVDTQPQNIEEELFLAVGQVVIDIVKDVPELDMVIQSILNTAFQSMKLPTMALDTVEDMIRNVLKDADQLQLTYLTLMTNQSEASVWIGHVLDSGIEVIMKIWTSEAPECEDLLGPFEWLLNTQTVKTEVWKSMICQNSSALLTDWLPLVDQAMEVYYTFTGQENYNVTLPMILSEWHKLYNNSLQFGGLLERLATDLGGAYWMDWMPDNSSHDVLGTLQQSAFLVMVNLGEQLENSQLWPGVKSYFHMVYWILNHRPGVASPPNCTVIMPSLALHCDTGLNWQQFVQAINEALMSPNQDLLVNYLKGTVTLLQHVYGDLYKNLAGSYLKQEIRGGDALSAYLINLMNNLDGLVQNISSLPDKDISNPDVMLPLIGNLFKSTGLTPLLPLLLSDGPLNISTVLDVTSKLGRLNQQIFTFNETDPTMPQLEQLIKQFLSLEGNLTLSLSNMMGHTVLSYSEYFHPESVAHLREAIRPFTNQTSAGIVEAIISAMELLKKVMDSPNGDPTTIILGYIHQLQEFVSSLVRLRRIQHLPVPGGNLSTDLYPISKDFLNLLTLESLQNLTQAGPDVAQDIVTQKFVQFLPLEGRQEAFAFFQDFKALQDQITSCAEGENCLAGISEIFAFLDQILDMMLSTDGAVSIQISANNSVLGVQKNEEIASLFFPLLLSSNDAAYVETFKQTLYFIRLIIARPNVTVADVQNALQQSNLTIEALNSIAALAGAANVKDLMLNIIEIINARQCFEPQDNPTVTVQCVTGLINGVGNFLAHVPALRNETIVSLIPLIVSDIIRDVAQVNFSSDPNMAITQTLNVTLSNIKTRLQQNHLNTPEIMNEIRVLEGLLQLSADPTPLNYLNSTLNTNSMYSQKVYLEIVDWYLKRLESITSNSSVSELLHPLFSLTQMQVTLQLSQTDFSLFVSEKVEYLMNSLQYPIDGAGVTKIGLATVEIIQELLDPIILNLEVQKNMSGSEAWLNTTILYATEFQIRQYLNLIQMWMKQPSVPRVLSGMLQWGNSSKDASSAVTDVQNLLHTMVNFLSDDELSYLSFIGNITQSLNKALMVAEQPGGLQSDHFSAAILEAVQTGMQVLTTPAGALPPLVQQNILEIVHDSLKLILQSNMSFASSRNISLLILKRAEGVIQQTVPEMFAQYLLPILKVATTYVESISTVDGPDNWNQIILNEMKTIQSLLPPNGTAEARYVLEYLQELLQVVIQSNMSFASSRDISLLILKRAEGLIQQTLPEMFAQYLLPILKVATTYVESISTVDGPDNWNQIILNEMKTIQSLLPQNNTAEARYVLEYLQELLQVVSQSNMSFASSRDISLLILKRAEGLIQQTLPEMFAQYLIPILKVATTYVESISTVDGPDNWNQIILNEMKTIQSLLPPNGTAEARYVLESLQELLKFVFQSDMSFASSRNISLLILKRAEGLIQQTLPEMFAQYLIPILKVATTYVESISTVDGPDNWNQIILNEMKTIQSLLPQNGTAEARYVLESLQELLQVVIQSNMSFASSRDISLLILKRAEGLIQQTVPEMFAQYLLPILKVATTYVESISTVDGPDNWNQIILNEMKTIQSLLPPNGTAEARYVLESLQELLQVVIQSNMSFASSRDISLLILKRAEGLIQQTVPEMFAQYLLPILKVATTYVESISTVDGPDNWNQIILNEMKTIQSLLPPNGTAEARYVLESLQELLQVVLQSNMSFASSRDISLLILKRAEGLIQQTVPEMFAQYLLPILKVATTYVESISTVDGPDNWNQIILNEMKTVRSLLPPNSTAQASVSTLIDITLFILEAGQGNMSLWASFENASVEDVPQIIGKIGKLVSMLWARIMGGSTAPPLGAFAHLAPVLEQVMTGKANQDTWDNLGKMLEAVLLILNGTELRDSIPSVILQFEKIMGSTVKETQARNELILSLQGPVATMMIQIAQSVNTSRFNLSEFSERMQDAIEQTVQAVHQANGTLECSDALVVWDPVRESAGISHAAMAMWCNINLQPIFEAYSQSLTVYDNLNMSHMDVGPMNVNATVARIVTTVQSLYHVNINSSLVLEQLVLAFSAQFSMLTGQPLSPEAQLNWQKQLQDMQLQNSLSSIKMLLDELLTIDPNLRPYTDAADKALSHILVNYQVLQGNGSAQHLFVEAAMIFLSSANISSDDLLSIIGGNFAGFNEESLADAIREAVKLVIDMNIFGDVPMVNQFLEQFLASNETRLIVQKVIEMIEWLTSTQASGLDLLTQAVPRILDILRPLLSLLTQMSGDLPISMEQFEDVIGNLFAMLRQLMSSSDLLAPLEHHLSMLEQGMTGGNHTKRGRFRRQAPLMPTRGPMDDFIDLFYIDYPTMFKAIAVPVGTEDIMETAHVFFGNPDLNAVVKGATNGMPWGLNSSREETVDAALGILSLLTVPGALQMSSADVLMKAAYMIPEGFPFSELLKNIVRVLANESEEILILIQETIQTAERVLQFNLTDHQFTEGLGHLRSQVCTLEDTETVRLLMRTLSIEPGQLCTTILPSLQIIIEGLLMNTTSLTDVLFQTVIGDPSTYDVKSDWTTVLGQGLGFNTSSLSSLNINMTSPGAITVGEILRDKEAFVVDVQQHMDFDPAAVHRLLNTTLPNNNLLILSWLVNLRHCNSTAFSNMKGTDVVLLKTFCSMSAEQWYSFLILMARHVNMETLIFRMVLSDEMQSVVGVMLQMAEVLTKIMDMVLPAIGQLQGFMSTIQELNLVDNHDFSQMARMQRSSISRQSTFVTLSRALCNNGILALFAISKLPIVSDSDPSFPSNTKREEMIERFKIPRDATPFCMNMYLDMVNTTGGAIAWAFLKPMLMGHILFTPDTPVTRDIMEKANATLQQFADVQKFSKDWIESSDYITQSAELLSQTLPMLQNSLGNSFVKNFIEMQTDIDVDRMKETLSNFSNMTVMLEKNKQIVNQITTLSTLMVDISSCVKFDRYHGYDSDDELNAAAQDLAKNRDLYASVIFKLPKDGKSSRKREARDSSSALPPKVSYTIRMHMDNVMRTDRVRDPYFVKSNHIWSGNPMRYNRGFIYLQESIDRAIIETQTGQKVPQTAVQIQPFPYPCHQRDEYLEAISFVFPIMLMMAWMLFVADFVKKLVYERELRLHEYMKMMGVNPLSHFFAWFLECATYLGVTIFILTLVLKYGNILPKSDGFLLYLYLCDYGLSILAFSYLVSSFFEQTYIAGLSGCLLYILFFFPFIVVMALETNLSFSLKSALGLFSPTCFSYASQYVSRYEAQGEGIQWSNSYSSPIAGDTASFGWLCWLMVIDSLLYFIIGAYIRKVFPGKYGIPSPWYFPFKASFWTDLCCCLKSNSKSGRGLLFSNIMQQNQPVFADDKGKGQSSLSSEAGEDFSQLPVGVAIHGLSKMYGDRVAIQNLNISFYEGHVTSLLGHNGAGKTTTMSLLTGLFAPSSGTIEVYGKDMETNINDVRKELGVCMQYDVLFEHMTTKEHLLLYGEIKAPHWSKRQLHEQVRTILEETGMYAHRHKRVGTLSGGMKRKLSISIAFIGGSRLVVLDEPTTGVDPCSRRSIWDIVIQHKKNRTIIMSTHHLDEAEVLSDRITFLENGGLKCCGSPYYLKDKLGQGYKLTLTKKTQDLDSEQIDDAELKSFIQAHVPGAQLKEAQGSDLVYSLPSFTSSNASSYRSLLTALDTNLDALQLGGYGISDTTLEEVFLQMTHDNTEAEGGNLSISETLSDTASIDSLPSDLAGSVSSFSDTAKLTGTSMVRGMALVWQQITAILIKRFHHSRRDWKGLIAQFLLPLLFMVFAMGLGSIKNDMQHYPKLKLSPALYNFDQSYSFFRNQNPSSGQLADAMMSFPGIDNACLDKSNDQVCERSSRSSWTSKGNSSKTFNTCRCTLTEQICDEDNYQPPHKKIPSSQVVFNLSGINVENYLVATANDFIRNRYGGFAFGMPLPLDLQMDLKAVPKNRTMSKVWFNPEGHHSMPAYLNSLNNFILRANLPADKDPQNYAISVSSHPYFGRKDDEDAIVQGMLQILVAMCVMTGFSITTASFAIYEVNEHHSGSKRLQHIAGISEPLYWIVNYFYDMIMYMIPVALTVAVVAAFQIPAFADRQNLGAVTLLLVLFGFSSFPWMYLLSGVFRDAEMAFITYVCINLFLSINTIMSTSILYFLGQIAHNPEIIQDIFKKLSQAFLIFPQFSFGNGLMQLTRNNIEVQILSGYGIDAYRDPFSTDALGWMFISSFIQGLVFFTLRLLLNRFIIRKVRHLICGRNTTPQETNEHEDEDVAAEHLRVSSGAASSDVLQVNHLTKVYQHLKKKVPAVKSLSVGIPAGECFGLLGVNGAGKTTTFKMLTGDVSPTDGTAQIRDWDGRLVDIMECRNQGINIGYCPQVDALDNLLTGEEHLYFYARVRGISKKEIDRVVNYLLKRLELNYHRNIITNGYSCGTRRKLSTAMALVGHPQILLLDEPSSGMDPRTKRHLWKIISEEVKGKCAVVLTSHSMEECEALCGRLAIMVKGQFRCLGSLQHIKNRFGSGFTVKMYLAEASSDAEAITGFMQRRFPSTYLKDQHSTMVEYHVPVAPGGVADIFDQLETNKNSLQIKHFSVSQTTLDEVFINFAMEKFGMETLPLDSDDDFDGPDSVKTAQS